MFQQRLHVTTVEWKNMVLILILTSMGLKSQIAPNSMVKTCPETLLFVI